MATLTARTARLGLSALVAALLIVPLAPAPSQAATEGFRDVTGSHQFYRQISWLTSKGITTGYEGKWFHPKREVSREAFAAFLYRLAGKPSVKLPGSSPFKDVDKSDQFYKEIVWLDSKNITTGWANGTYRPKSNISRSAMAAFLYRYKERPSYSPPKKSKFKDMENSSKFYKEVSWLASSGMTTGFSDGTFRPYWGTSREATAAFLFRGFGSSSYKAPKYVAPKLTYAANAAVNAAKGQVGYRESSWRKNKFNTWINGSNAWCGVYVAWAFEKSGNAGFVPKTKHFDTYVSKLRSAKVLDWNVSLKDLQKGDVVLFDWKRGNNPTHTGIVDRVSGNGAWFYEGNTTDGTGNTGRGVFHRWRDLGYIAAVFDPQDYYDATH